MRADINKDGILDIIIEDLESGLAVLNPMGRSVIRMTRGIPKRHQLTETAETAPTIYLAMDNTLEILVKCSIEIYKPKIHH